VASAEEPDGTELQLAPDNNPAARAYQHAVFEQGQPAAVFYVDDAQREYDRMKPLSAEFSMPPTKVTGSTIAMLKRHLRQPDPNRCARPPEELIS
jgi:hypothetical protein